MATENLKKRTIKQIPVSVIDLSLIMLNTETLNIVPESNELYDDSFLIKCTKPISIQTYKSIILSSGFKLATPQPFDNKDGTNIVTAPYHIEWKVEPNIDLLMENNIWAYGSSGSIINPELKLVLFNFGDKIFNTVKGTTIATLQFYLVPKLQIKKVKNYE